MGERLLYRRLVIMGIVVGTILVVDSSGLLSDHASIILDDLSQLAAGLIAAACCLWSARRTAGYERTWRWLMAVGFGAWSCGQAIWSWYQVVRNVPFPSPSLADVGYLAMPVFAFAALLVITANGGWRRGRLSGAGFVVPSWVVLVLDALIITGSLLVLTLSTTLGVVLQAGASNAFAFAVALAYPVTDVVLVVMVLLMLSIQPVAERLRPQLVLLGFGLVGLVVSDSIFTYLSTIGAPSMPPLANAGFIAGPLLIALAAVTTVDPRPRRDRQGSPRRAVWVHLLLPYFPLLVTGCFIVVHELNGKVDQKVELFVGIPTVALVVLRQMVLLIDNTALLDRVADTQEKLQFQADHDPVTGLANRTLFRTRVAEAVHTDAPPGRPIALYFLDLDDFKAVNDRLGHASGDLVLQAVADRLRSCVRAGDLVARLGGDEFGVLTEGDAANPADIGRRIQAALREPFAVNGDSAVVGASMGAVVATGAEPGLTTDVLLQRADDAMYQGKRQGKGLLVFYVDS